MRRSLNVALSISFAALIVLAVVWLVQKRPGSGSANGGGQQVSQAGRDEDASGSGSGAGTGTVGEKGQEGRTEDAGGEEAVRATSSESLVLQDGFYHPAPAPELPEAFDPYAPPKVDMNAAGRIGFSKWTTSAGPDEHVVMAGYGFPSDSNPAKKVRFTLFGQTAGGKYQAEADIVSMFAYQAFVRIPEKAPLNSMYLVYPRSDQGRGRPAVINRAEIWYTVEEEAAPGERVSLVGRNLSHDHGEKAAWVYLAPKGTKKLGTWATVTKVNPYKVDFIVPESLSTSAYEVWAHNGHGGRYGWSPMHGPSGGSLAPEYLKVRPAHTWTGPTINVTAFGADGDDGKDDTEAVLKALARANQKENATLYFPEGTYFLSKQLKLSKPLRITGDGMKKTYVKGMPGHAPGRMIYIKTGNIEIRSLVLCINELGETKKFYRGADRGEHNPEHYDYLEKLDKAREKLKKWKKKHKGEPVPERLQPPESPGFPGVKKRNERVAPAKKGGRGDLMKKDVWAGGLEIINCVLDAERRNISLLKGGISNGMLKNCDIVAQEVKLGCPKHARIEDCNFYGRADTGVMMYMYGGWNNVITGNTGQDYMPNTFDTAMGRFYTVSAYGNRQENVYIGGNRTRDLTVNPLHYNQNSGEQIMWEDMPIYSAQKPENVGKKTITLPKKIKKGKIKWYSDAIVASGKGLGQYRRIASYDKKNNRIKLVRPWDVQPNTESTILVGRPIRRIVVYGNYLDAKPRAYQSEDHIASSGVQAFGASVDLLVERNTFHEIRGGIPTFSPYLFHRYEDNKFVKNRTAIRVGNGTGLSVRRNVIHDPVKTAYQTTSGKKHGVMGLEIVEHNRGVGTPNAIRLGNRYGAGIEAAKLLLYKNDFRAGDVEGKTSIGIQAPDRKNLILIKNAFQGFDHQVKAK